MIGINEQLWWYVARSGGITALVLTGLSVIWGLALSTKVMNGAPAPKWLLALHRRLGALSVIFTAIHVIALIADSYVSFGLADVLIPFASDWKPGAVAWGIVSMYLLIAVQVSSMLMKRIPRKVWKAIHLSTWLLFWTGLIHGITAGTDAAHPVYVAVTGTMTLLITFLTGYRIFHAKRRRLPRPATQASVPSPATPGI